MLLHQLGMLVAADLRAEKPAFLLDSIRVTNMHELAAAQAPRQLLVDLNRHAATLG
jgi:hypothetical protein